MKTHQFFFFLVGYIPILNLQTKDENAAFWLHHKPIAISEMSCTC